MSGPPILRFAEHVHGHLGWLSVGALLHPAILLRRPVRRARAAVVLATVLTTLSGSLGAWLYPAYRARLKRALFIEMPSVGWLFERKEHLAVGAIGLAWIGCIAHLAAPTFGDEARRRATAVLAHRAFALAFLLGFAVACLGLWVASHRTF